MKKFLKKTQRKVLLVAATVLMAFASFQALPTLAETFDNGVGFEEILITEENKDVIPEYYKDANENKTEEDEDFIKSEVATVFYTFETPEGETKYRVYGTYNEKNEGFYEIDEDFKTVNKKMVNLEEEFNLLEYQKEQAALAADEPGEVIELETPEIVAPEEEKPETEKPETEKPETEKPETIEDDSKPAPLAGGFTEVIPAVNKPTYYIEQPGTSSPTLYAFVNRKGGTEYRAYGMVNSANKGWYRMNQYGGLWDEENPELIDLNDENITLAPFNFVGKPHVGDVPSDPSFIVHNSGQSYDVYKYTSNKNVEVYRAYGVITNVADVSTSEGWYTVDQNGQVKGQGKTGNHLLAMVENIEKEFTNLSNNGFIESTENPSDVPGFYQKSIKDVTETITRRDRFYNYTDRNGINRFRVHGTIESQTGYFESDQYGNVDTIPVIVDIQYERDNLSPTTQNPGGPLSDNPGEAFISSLAEAEVNDGTAGGGLNPDSQWDPNDEPGNDSGPHNGIVRSFDKLSYKLEFATQVKATSSFTSFTNAKVYFEVTITNLATSVTFDKEEMKWINDLKIIDNGSSQTLTGWYFLSPTDGSNAIPNNRELLFNFKVGAAANGEVIEPVFKGWLETTDKEGDDAKTITGKAVTVSASPNIDAQIKTVGNIGYNGEFDFVTGNRTDTPNTNSKYGRIDSYALQLLLKGANSSRGMKGIEVPDGKINVEVDMTYTDPKGADISSTHYPLLWDYKNNFISHGVASSLYNGKGELGRTTYWDKIPTTDYGAYTVPYSPHYSMRDSIPKDFRTVYNNPGIFNITQNNEKLQFEFDLYEFDDEEFRFPTHNSGYPNTRPRNYDNNEGVFAVAFFEMVSYIPKPEEIENSNDEYRLKLEIKDFNAKSISGIVIDNQDSKNDIATNNIVVYKGNGASKIQWIFGPDRAKRYTSDVISGDGWEIPGSTIYPTSVLRVNGDQTAHSANILQKFDGEEIELIPGKTSSDMAYFAERGVVKYNTVRMYYAAKPDGTGWNNLEEMDTARETDLIYFSSADALIASGKKPIGLLYEFRDGKFEGDAWLRMSPEGVLRVSENAVPGEVYTFINDARYWTSKNDLTTSDTMLNNDPTNPTKLPNPTQYITNETNSTAKRYRPSEYLPDGTFVNDNGYQLGTSMLIVGTNAQITKGISQKNGSVNKSNFNLDNGERVVDYTLNPILRLGNGSLPNESSEPIFDTVYIKDTINKGLTYIPNSTTFGGDYVQPSVPGQAGSVVGGKSDASVQPSVEINGDGTTTLTWKIENVKVGSNLDRIRYSVQIGDVFDPTNDVEHNQPNLSNTVEIRADNDGRRVDPINKNTANTTISVSKLGGTSFSKNITDSLNEIGDDIGYELSFSNQSATDLANVKILDILPYKGDGRGTNYDGDYRIDKITIDYSRVPTLSRFNIKYTDTTAIQNQSNNASNVNVSSWDTATRTDNGKTSTYEIPFGKKITAFAIEGNLNAMTGVKITYHLDVTNNKPMNIYGNSSTVTSGPNQTLLSANTVQAKVARRTISGTAWIDSNRNGAIDPQLNEKYLSGVEVILRNKDGSTVTDVLGNTVGPTTTNALGKYSFTNLPSGDFYVEFLDTKTKINMYTVTTLHASGVSPDNDNDAIGNYGSDGKLTSATIPDIKLPALDDMRNMDHVEAGLNFGVYSGYSITKTATSSSGNLENVKEGDVVEYTITVQSPSKQSNFQVKDTIQDGLSFVPDSISYQLNGESEKSLADNRYTANRPTILWDPVALPAGTSTFSFKAVVDKLPEDTKERKLKNVAIAIDRDSGYELPSNEVELDAKTRSSSINKTASLVKNGVVQPVDNGLENFPIQADLSQEIEYTLIVKNTGSEGTVSEKINVSDVIPNGTSYVVGSQNITFYDSTDGTTVIPGISSFIGLNSEDTLEWTLDKMKPEEEAHIKFRVKTNADADDASTPDREYKQFIDNQAKLKDLQKESLTYKERYYDKNGDIINAINKTVYSEKQVNLDSNKTHHFIAEPAIDIVKSSNPVDTSTVVGNQEITYTLVVNNFGEDVAKTVVVEDMIPANTTLVANSLTSTLDARTVKEELSDRVKFTVTNIPDGGSVTLTFKVKANELLTGNGSSRVIENTATAKLNDDQPIESNKVTHNQDLSYTVVKTSNPHSTPANITAVAGGSEITYTMNITNTGNEVLNGLSIEDVIPTNTTYKPGSIASSKADAVMDDSTSTLKWTVGGIAKDEVATVSFTVIVDTLTQITPEAQARLIENTAQYKLAADPSFTDTNTITHKQFADFTIEKSANPPSGSFVDGGKDLVYSIKVTNTGTDPLNNLEIKDTVPTHTNYKTGSIGFVAKDGVTFTADDSAAPIVKWTVSGLKAGESATVNFTVIPQDYYGDTERIITNVADAKLPDDPTWTESNEVIHKQKYGFTVNKSSSVTTEYVDGKQVVEYTIAVTNTATETVYGFELKDAIPEFTKYVNNSANLGGTYSTSQKEVTWVQDIPGKTTAEDVVVNFRFRVTIDPLTKVDERPITNIARYKTTVDPTYTDTNEITFKQKADYTIVKSSDPQTTAPNYTAVDGGQTITYKLLITNTGEETLQDLVISDAIPANTTYVNGSITPSGDADIDTTLINGNPEWTINNFGKDDEPIELTFQVKVDKLEVVGDREIKNIASATLPDDATPKTSNETIHTQGLKFEVHKTGEIDDIDPQIEYVDGGQFITYTISVTNKDTETINSLFVKDLTPEHTELVAGSAKASNGATVVTETSIGVDWEVKGLKAGETINLTFKVKADVMEDEGERIIENTATYRLNTTRPADAEDTETVTHKQKTAYTIKKLSDPVVDPTDPTSAIVNGGQVITYTIEVTNTGEDTLQNLKVTDDVPEFTTFKEMVAFEGNATVTDSKSGDTITWNVSDLAKGETVKLKFAVTVNQLNVEGTTEIRNIGHAWLPEQEPTPKETNEIIHKQSMAYNVVKTSDVAEGLVTGGEVITYTITVTNDSSETLRNLSVVDAIPQYTKYQTETGYPTQGGTYNATDNQVEWLVEEIAGNSSVELKFQVKVDNLDYTGTRDITNIAQYKLPTDATYKDTNEIEHQQESAYSMVKSSDPVSGSVVKGNDVIEYTLTLTNEGHETLNNFKVEDVVPAGTKYVTEAGYPTEGGVYDEATNTIKWTLNGLEKDEILELKFKVKVDELNTIGNTSIENSATYGLPKDQPRETNEVNHTQNLNYEFHKTSDVAEGYVDGDTVITYTLSVQNHGKEPLREVVVTDNVPANTTLVDDSMTTTHNGVMTSGSELKWQIANIPAGETATLTFQVKVNRLDKESDDRLIENTAYVKIKGETDTTPSETITHKQQSSYTAVKSSDVTHLSSVTGNQEIEYTVTITNTGEETLRDLVVTDAVPEHTEYVVNSITNTAPAGTTVTESDASGMSWTLDGLKKGESATLSFKVTVTPITESGQIEIKNIAHTKLPSNPDKPTNEIIHYQNFGFEIEKTSDVANDTYVIGREDITYTIKVKNTSTETLRNVVIEDSVPEFTKLDASSITSNLSGIHTVAGDVIRWTFDEIKANETATVTFTVKVDDLNVVGSRDIKNIASVTVDDLDPMSTNEIIHHQNLAYTVVKTSDIPEGTVDNGDIIEYVITITNSSEREIMEDFSIRDLVPEGTEYVDNSIAMDLPGTMTGSATEMNWTIDAVPVGTTTVSFKVKVLPMKEQGEHKITNTAYTKFPDTPEEPTNPIEHEQKTSYTVVKESDPETGSSVTGGQEVTYKLVVTNTGTETLQDLVVTDMIPEHTKYKAGTIAFDNATVVTDDSSKTLKWTVNGLEAGEVVNLSFTVVVDDLETPGERTITNVAQHKLPDEPTTPTNPVDLEQSNSYRVEKSSLPVAGIIRGGDTITYSIKVENTGTETLKDISVKDAVPAGTTLVTGTMTSTHTATMTEGTTLEWVIGSLPKGETATVTFDVKVTPMTDKGENTILNVANVKLPKEPTPTPTNEIEHKQNTNYTAEKSSNPVSGSYVSAGDEIEYSIKITNTGDEPLQNLNITDEIPTGTTYIPGSITFDTGFNVTTDDSSSTLKWVVNGLRASEEVNVSFKVTVDSMGAGTENTITNVAQTNLPDEPKTPTNETEHFQKAGYTISKSSNPVTDTMVDANQIITYTITVENTEHETLKDFSVRDVVPTNTTLVPGSMTSTHNATMTEGATLDWVFEGIPGGESAIVTFQVKVNPMTDEGERTITNIAQGKRAEETDYTDTNEIIHKQKTAYTIKKLSDPAVDPSDPTSAIVDGGQVITYTIEVTNTGEDTLHNLTVTDDVPEFTTFKEMVAFEGNATVTDSKTGDTITWNVSDLAKGETVKLKFAVTVNELNVEGTTEIKNVGHAWLPDQEPTPKETNEIIHKQSMAYNVVKSSDVAQGLVTGGQVITYTITVTNESSETLRNLSVVDAIPEFTKYQTEAGYPTLGGTYNATDDQVEWLIDEIDGNSSIELKFQVKVDDLDYTGTRDITNVAEYKLPADVNYQETNEIEHKQQAQYSMVKASDPVSGSVVHGNDVIEYTLTLTNEGHETLNNLHVEDMIPAGTQYVTEAGYPTAGGVYDESSKTINWTVNNLAKGESLELKFKVKVDELNTIGNKDIANTATYNLPKDQPRDTNEVNHTQDLNYEFHKTSDVAEGYVDGDAIITYTLTVENKGNEPLRNVVVADDVPANTKLVDNSMTTTHSGVMTNGTELKWEIANIPSGETATLTFQVKVDRLDKESDDRLIENTAYVKIKGETDTTPSETITHKQQSSYTAEKSSDVTNLSSVTGNQEIEYTVTISNTGEETLRDLVVTDAIPDNTTYVANSITHTAPAGTTVTESDASGMSWTLNGLKKGETATLNFKVKVVPITTEGQVEIKNIAHTKLPSNPDKPTNEIIHYQNFGFEIEKSSDVANDTFVIGKDTITYTITVKNTNTETLRDVIIEDSVPEFTKLDASTITSNLNGKHKVKDGVIKWTFDEIKVNETATASFTVTVDEMHTIGARDIKNTAMVTIDTLDPVSTNEIIHHQNLDYTVVKSSDVVAGSLVDNGDIIEYVITIANNSEKEIMRNFSVRDLVPEGTEYVENSIAMDLPGSMTGSATEMNWTIDAVPVGTTTVSFKVKVLPMKEQGEHKIINTAYTKFPDTPEEPTNPIEHEQKTSYTVVKESDPVSGSDVTGGQEVTYKLVVTNTGNETLQDLVVIDMIPECTKYKAGSIAFDNATVVTDDSSKTLKWTVNGLEAGEVVNLSFTVIVDDLETPGARTITNMAQYKLPDEPTTPTNPVVVEQDSSYKVAKSSNPVEGVVKGGQTITYSITVENTGSETLKNISVKDEVPAGTTLVTGTMASTHTATMTEGGTLEWVIGSIPKGETATVSFDVTVNPMEDKGDTTILNVATVKLPKEPDPTPTNPIEHTQHTDYTAEKSSNPVSGSYVSSGDEIEYTITVTNTGDEPLQNLNVTDVIPESTTYVADSIGFTTGFNVTTDDSSETLKWVINDLEAGETVDVSFKVTVDPMGALTENTITNIAHTNLPKETPVPTNEVEHFQKAGYTISKASTPETGTMVDGNDTITYRIAVENTENETLKGFMIRDVVPEHTTLVPGSMTSTHTATMTEGETLEWTIGSIPSGETAVVTFDVKVDPMTTIGKRDITNIAEGKRAGETEYTPTNEILHKQQSSYLAVKSSDPVSGSVVSIDDVITYTIKVSNNGNETLRNMTIEDVIPAGTEYIKDSATSSDLAQTTISQSGDTLSWKIAEIEKDGMVEVSFKVRVLSVEGKATIKNVANTNLPDEPKVPTNEVDHYLDTGYTLSKASDPVSGSTVQRGQDITYTMTVTNTGESTLKNLEVKDTVPENTQYITGSSTSSDENAIIKDTEDTITWTIPELAPGASKTVSFKVRVNSIPKNQEALIKNTAYAKLPSEKDYRPSNEVVHNVPSVKDPVKPEPPVKPTDPTKPVLPQTGMGQNYTGIYFTVLGLLLVAINEVLDKRRRLEAMMKDHR